MGTFPSARKTRSVNRSLRCKSRTLLLKTNGSLFRNVRCRFRFFWFLLANFSNSRLVCSGSSSDDEAKEEAGDEGESEEAQELLLLSLLGLLSSSLSSIATSFGSCGFFIVLVFRSFGRRGLFKR